ncbi:MAG TPA: outer membrane beta-barrel protein, partial [Chitinophaga sp.]|uniref:outer membrane beta-barrel protein n=1 Tax=Chitinophaga sp. TaxID=1869181 RepID=UPI002B6DAC71
MKILRLSYFVPLLFLYAYAAAQERPDSGMKPTNLKEVKVTGRKPQIEIKKEKVIFHVNNTVNATGFNAFDLLKKLPGVVVDNQNNILLKGTGGVKVMINNKLVQLSRRELVTMLKSMSSTQVEDIEVISNPSAKYDAAGTGGLININTRKYDKYGLNGSLSTTFTYGLTPKYNNDLSLNYGNSRLNTYLNVSAANEQYNRKLTSERTITRADKSSIYYNDNMNGDDKTDAYSIRTGLDYIVSKKSTIGAMFNGGISHDRSDALTFTSIGKNADKIDSFLYSGVNEETNSKNFAANLNYRYKDTSGTSFSTDLDFVKFNYDDNTLQPNTFYTTDNKKIRDEDIRIKSSSDINIFAFKADYSRKLFRGTFEAGWKSSLVKSTNDFSFFNVQKGVDLMDTAQTNRFDYTENINAAYVNYSRTYSRFAWQAGVRVEQTYARGVLIPLRSSVKTENERTYVDVFPSATISYDLDKKNSFALFYSRRIDRPNYQYLNPFEKRLTILVYDKGDPFLVPQYTDKVSLMHVFNKFLTSSLNYSYTSNLLNQVIDTVDGSKIVYQRANLGAQRRFSFDISGSWPILKWWNAYATLNFYNNNLKG